MGMAMRMKTTKAGIRGFALAGLLLVVSALAVVAAWLGRSSTLSTHLAGAQTASERAYYVAEAATQEAIWLIKNNPAYMLANQGMWRPVVARSLGGFSYQYRALRRLDNTWRIEGRADGGATCAATLRFYDPSADSASGGSPVMLCYGREGSTTPFHRCYDEGAWSSAGAASDTGGVPCWVVAASCPVKEEKVLAVLGSGGQLTVQVWNGTAWSAATTVATLDVATRGFDLAYETLSGRAMLAWAGGPNTLTYMLWNGATWSAQYSLALTTTGTPRWVRLRANPRSNEIIAGWATEAGHLGGAVWNGAGFGSMQVATTSLRTTEHECFAVTYESLSGCALALWQTGSSTWLSYARWMGSYWSGPRSGPNVQEAVNFVRAAADPASNYIVAGTLDAAGDVNVWLWNGSSWGSGQEVERGAQTSSRRCFDVAYGYPGGQAVVAWAKSGATRLKFRRWSGRWAAMADGPDMGAASNVVQLEAEPYSQRLFAQVETAAHTLLACSWDGHAWEEAPTTIEVLLPDVPGIPFMLSSGYSPEVGTIYNTGIDADNRDAESVNNDERTNGVSFASRQGRFGVHSSGSQVFQSGLEFRLSIPRAAQVTEAYLTLTSDETDYTGWSPTGPFTATVHVMDVGNAAVFNPLHNHDMLHHAPTWPTTVDWPVDAWEPLVQYRSPNLAALVQRVIARGDWSPGNYIGFVVSQGDAMGSSFRGFKEYTTSPQQAARLTVIYSLP